MNASNKIAPEETIELNEFNSNQINEENKKRNRKKILIGVGLVTLVALIVGLGFLINSVTSKTNASKTVTSTVFTTLFVTTTHSLLSQVQNPPKS